MIESIYVTGLYFSALKCIFHRPIKNLQTKLSIKRTKKKKHFYCEFKKIQQINVDGFDNTFKIFKRKYFDSLGCGKIIII